jgi:hypothetical protein
MQILGWRFQKKRGVGEEIELNLTVYNNSTKPIDFNLYLFINFQKRTITNAENNDFFEYKGEKSFKIQPFELRYISIILKCKSAGNYGSEYVSVMDVPANVYIPEEELLEHMKARGILNKLYLVLEHDGITTFSTSFGLYVGPKPVASEHIVGAFVIATIIAFVPLFSLNYGIKISKKRRRGRRIEKEK